MINKHLLTSKNEEWETPQFLFNELNETYDFDLDVCASETNKKCHKFYSKDDNSLDKYWIGSCWMNPPYGKSIATWMKKAYESHVKNKALVVCLVPCRTDTQWWHDYAIQGSIFFIKGRIRFVGASQPAPFPSAIIVYGGGAPIGYINESLDLSFLKEEWWTDECSSHPGRKYK